jgi:serine/threonine protein kinase
MPAQAHESRDGRQSERRLGKYELIRRIAVGGMAEIFLARVKAVHGFEKLVVVKRILPQYAEDEDFVRMLLDEARLAATLHHPNIVQVYDMGIDEETGQSFFAMEYVRGQDLRRIIRGCNEKETWLPLEHVLNIVIGTAGGLHHAHEQVGLDGRPLAIVHRDVSPSNILVTYAGAVKLVDFGIAKATGAQSTTRHGTLKGKIPYMSPEQCRGERLDRRSDIFSLGTVLWELSTGSRLFKADNELATLSRIANEDPPPPSWKRPDYPKALEEIVMRALTRDRDARYQTAQELQLDLEEFAREQKLAVSSTYLARFMQDLFAGEIAREVQEAKAEPDNEIQTLLTADLQFLAPHLLEAEGNDTAEFSPAELAQFAGPEHVAAQDETRPPSHSSVPTAETGSQSVLLDLGAAIRRRRRIGMAAAAAGGAATVGLIVWLASGDSEPETPSQAEPQTTIEATPVPAVAAPTPEPTPPTAVPEPVPVPVPVPPAAEPEPEPEPEPKPKPKSSRPTKKRGSKSKKKKKKKDDDWNPDSFMPP